MSRTSLASCSSPPRSDPDAAPQRARRASPDVGSMLRSGPRSTEDEFVDLCVDEVEAHPSHLLPAVAAVEGDRGRCGWRVDDIEDREVAAGDSGAPCVFEESPADALPPIIGVDQEASDVDRRLFGDETCDEVHDRWRGLGVQGDVADEPFVANGYPRCERLRPGQKPLEVPVREEARVLVRLMDSNDNRDEFLEIIVTPIPNFHGHQSVCEPSLTAWWTQCSRRAAKPM